MNISNRKVPDWISQVKPVCLSDRTALPAPELTEKQKQDNANFVAQADENKSRGWSND